MGYALPRSLRSDSCNAYFCDSVREFQRHYVQTPKKQLFIIRRDHDNWSRFDKIGGNNVLETRLIQGEQIDVVEC